MKKETRGTTIRSRRVLALAFITLLLAPFAYRGCPALYSQVFENDFNNPFYDIFTMYFYDRKAEAKKRLLGLMGDRRYANHAAINYGILNEREGNRREAEVAYRNAMERDEYIAAFYLENLYSAADPAKLARLYGFYEVFAGPERRFWIEYQRAVYHLKENRKDEALRHLSLAVDKGFASPDLLANDPAFDPVRNEPAFKTALAAAQRKRYARASLGALLERAEDEYYQTRPYGLSKELKKIVKERNGRIREAEDALSSLLSTNLALRDRCIVLYWLARIRAEKGDTARAKQYLAQFKAKIDSGETDRTGFREAVAKVYPDLIQNDPVLKKVKQ